MSELVSIELALLAIALALELWEKDLSGVSAGVLIKKKQ